jgi:hypothetical protein
MTGVPCTVCLHPARDLIDGALVGGVPMTTIAATHGVSRYAVQRHRNKHLPERLVKAHDAAEVASADIILGNLAEYERLLRDLASPEKNDGRLNVQALDKLIRLTEILARLQDRIKDGPSVNVVIAPAWLTVRKELMLAQDPILRPAWP